MLIRWQHVMIFGMLAMLAMLNGFLMSTADAKSVPIVIAIDAGHGGKDPGALGQNRLQEKQVNLAVAKKLHALLAKDPQFKPVLTRSGDYFISVAERSDIARGKNANFLISIHADAAQNNQASGSSVWVLSNQRADSEMGRWLEQQEKQSELLGGGGDALSHSENNPYLSQAVLDLQFAHAQRVGYAVAANLLTELKKVGSLHKRVPEHASFGVLRSPDIPSLLVEVGFISNHEEERLLGSEKHRDRLAQAIYQGLRRYYLDNPLLAESKTPSLVIEHIDLLTRQAHQVESGQTLYSIARQYHITVAELKSVNQLTSDVVKVGQRLQIPVANTTPAPTNRKKHVVVAGDSLSTIAQKYQVTMTKLMQVNQLQTSTIKIGQSLIIP